MRVCSALIAVLLLLSATLHAAATPVDLTKAVNMGFRDELDGDKQGGWTDQGGNDFRHMPVGEQTLCGVPFSIIDPTKNGGKSCIVLRGAGRDYFADKVSVPVGKKAGAIAFLHTLAWGDKKPVAHYAIQYASGKSVDIPIRQGQEIVGWWGLSETDKVKVAIKGKNLAARLVCVHAWVWTNPHPDDVIKNIELRSTNSKGIPIVVAMTLLDKPVTLTSEHKPPPVPTPGFVMIEAETFTKYNVEPFVTPKDEDEAKTGKKEYPTWANEMFSGGALFEIKPPNLPRAPGAAVPQYVKDRALKLEYTFKADKEAVYTFWARLGPANVYSPFKWRVDDGEWGIIKRENPFLDMYDISMWVTLGWINLGTRKLTAGKHTLHVVVPQPGTATKEAEEETQTEDLERELGLDDPVENEDRPKRGKKAKKHSKKKERAKKNAARWIVMADCFAATRIPFYPSGKLQPGEVYNTIRWLDGPARIMATDMSSEPIAMDGTRERWWLDGTWEMARDQEPIPSPYENDPEKLHGPIAKAPMQGTLHWLGVKVPHLGDKRSQLSMLHKRWYRKFVGFPKDLKGKRVSIHFGEVNYTASIFVNRKLCGTHFGGYVPFGVDITDALVPGESNEILVGVKGLGFYRRDFMPEAPWYMRRLFWRQMLVPGKTGWHKDNSDGIAGSVWLETHGQVMGHDVFVQSKYADKKLITSVEVANRSGKPFAGKVRFSVHEVKDNKLVSEVGVTDVSLAPGKTTLAQVTGPADRLTPWWPLKAKLYTIRASILEADGKAVDVSEDTFGYREITLKDKHVFINGKRCNFRSLISGVGESLDEVVAGWREYKCNTLRLPHSGWNRYFTRDPQRATLRFADEQGIAVRFNSQINGMFIDLATNDDLFWQNATQYYKQYVKAYRNHPSIIVWTAENELDLISNMANHKDFKEREWKMMRTAHAIDPTRPVMGDGAGDLLGQCEICNWHYCESGPIVDPNDLKSMKERGDKGVDAIYPDNAFTLAKVPSKCATRPWDRERPLWVGETYFYSGEVKWQGWIGGDEALSGRFAADRASARFVNMLVRGYRWVEAAGFNMFLSHTRVPGEEIKRSMAPVAVFAREYNRNVYAGDTLKRTARIFNDTLDPSPIEFAWTFKAGERVVDQGKSTHTIEEGCHEQVELNIQTLKTVPQRTACTLTFRLTRGGKPVFVESHPVWIHPRGRTIKNPKGLPIWLHDPKQVMATHLQALGLKPQALARLEDLESKQGLLIIGPEALEKRRVFGMRYVMPFVAKGGRALVLRQKEPVPYEKKGVAVKLLPVPLASQQAAGSFAFPRGVHPALTGVQERDLCCWAAGHMTFEGTYVRGEHWPILVEASTKDGMNLAPVVEMPWGKGHYLLSQMRFEPNLGKEPIADLLLANFIEYLLSRPMDKAKLAVLHSKQGGEELVLRACKIDARPIKAGVGLDLAIETALEEAKVVMIPGTQKNLAALHTARDSLDGFARRGGYVVVNGLGQGGLQALQRIIGQPLMLRPVGQERITVVRKDDPLMAGIGNHDFYRTPLLSKVELEELHFLHGDKPLMDNVFTGAILYEDLCPLTGESALFNGLTSEDHWKYISYRGDGPVKLNLRKPYLIHRVVVRENRHYKWIQEIALSLDGDKEPILTKAVPKKKQPIVFEFKPRKVQTVTLTPTKIHTIKPGPTGWDIVEIHRVLSDAFKQSVVPFTRPAGLVKFPMAKGGIILNMLPLDHELSRRVLAQLLHNLGVGRSAKAAEERGIDLDNIGDNDGGGLELDDL